MKAWFYSEKYPDTIREFEYNDKLYLKSEKTDDIDTLNYLVTNYNIDLYQDSDFDMWLPVYNPYEDKDLFRHDRDLGGPHIISLTSKEHLEEYFNNDRISLLKNMFRKAYNLGGFDNILNSLNEAQSCIIKKDYVKANQLIDEIKEVIKNEEKI